MHRLFGWSGVTDGSIQRADVNPYLPSMSHWRPRLPGLRIGSRTRAGPAAPPHYAGTYDDGDTGRFRTDR